MSLRGGIRRSGWPLQPSVGPHHRYRLVAPMAVDRLGELWDAWDDVQDESVIVRLLPSLQDERQRASFVERDIATARATLSHRNVAHIVAVELSGRPPFVVNASPGSPYPVAQILQRGRRLPASASFSIAAQVAAALAGAHEVGIFHGCLSSANVCVTSSGRVLVLDFGLHRLNWWTMPAARLAGPSDASSRRAEDVRELVLILLAMVIGPDASAIARLHGLTRQLRVRLREAAPRLSTKVIPLIDGALQPDAQRVPDARDIAEALGGQRPQIALSALRVPLPQDAPHHGIDALRKTRQLLDALALPWSAVKMLVGWTSGLVAWRRHLSAALRSKRWSLRRRAREPTTLTAQRALALAALVSVVVVCCLLISLAVVGRDRGASSIPVRSQPTPASVSQSEATRPASGGRSTNPPVTGVDRPTVRVPDVKGLTALAARKKLAKSHLQLTSLEPAVGPPGVVLRSMPAAGRAVATGSRVRLIVGADAVRVHPTPSESPT
jgi:hypothetical protein